MFGCRHFQEKKTNLWVLVQPYFISHQILASLCFKSHFLGLELILNDGIHPGKFNPTELIVPSLEVFMTAMINL